MRSVYEFETKCPFNLVNQEEIAGGFMINQREGYFFINIKKRASPPANKKLLCQHQNQKIVKSSSEVGANGTTRWKKKKFYMNFNYVKFI